MSHDIHSHAGSLASTPLRFTGMDENTTTPARTVQDIIRDIQTDVDDLRREENSPSRTLDIVANARNYSSSRNDILIARASPVQQHGSSATLPTQTGPPLHASGHPPPRTPQTRAILHEALGPSSSSQNRILARTDNQLQNAPFRPQLAPENRSLNATFQGSSENGTTGGHH